MSPQSFKDWFYQSNSCFGVGYGVSQHYILNYNAFLSRTRRNPGESVSHLDAPLLALLILRLSQRGGDLLTESLSGGPPAYSGDFSLTVAICASSLGHESKYSDDSLRFSKFQYVSTIRNELSDFEIASV